MDIEKMQIRMGEMAAEIERLNVANDQITKAQLENYKLATDAWDSNKLLRAENARLQAIIDEANAQEPVEVANIAGRIHDFIMEKEMGDYPSFDDIYDLIGFAELYARPIPAQQSPVTATDERTSEFGEPETVYLQLHDPDDGNEKSHGSNYKADGVTWCWHPINENDVRYIRADLFQQSPAVVVPDAVSVLDKAAEGIENQIANAGLRNDLYDAGYLRAIKRELIKLRDNILSQSPRITEQHAREIIKSFQDFADEDESAYDESAWLTYMAWQGHTMLNKLNNNQ